MTSIIIGVDENAWGCIAGPLIVTAAAFTETAMKYLVCKDSKMYKGKCPAKGMARDASQDTPHCLAAAVVEVHADTMTSVGYYQSKRHAFQAAVARVRQRLSPRYPLAIVDGNDPLGVPHSRAVVKADASIRAVAYASVIGKLVQKTCMSAIDRLYPQFGFSYHAGYGSPKHILAIEAHGIIPGVHRRKIVCSMLRGHTLATLNACDCSTIVPRSLINPPDPQGLLAFMECR